MFNKSLKVFIILTSLFSLSYASDDISLNVIETQRHGSHLFIDIEIQNFLGDTIYLKESIYPSAYVINKDDRKNRTHGICGLNKSHESSSSLDDYIPLGPESSILLQIHIKLKRKIETVNSIQLVGSYYVPVPGKMDVKRFKPLEIETTL